jgi:hypothetical protein
MDAVKNVLWFAAAAVVVVAFWSIFAKMLLSWVNTTTQWKRFDGLRRAAIATDRVVSTVWLSGWALWVLRPLPLVVPIRQRADRTTRLMAKFNPAPAFAPSGTKSKLVHRPISQKAVEQDDEQTRELLNRTIPLDFRYAVAATVLFLAAWGLGIVGWVSLIRL